MSLDNQTANPIAAQSNWWGCPTTIEMDTGVSNISLINDVQDNPSYGAVDYSRWLNGSEEWVLYAAADIEGGARDVVLSWQNEPSGPLHIMRGTVPTLFIDRGQAPMGALSYRDEGALDDENPILFYKVTGPCK